MWSCSTIVLFLAYFSTDVNSQCCPEGAWGELSNEDYVEQGSVDNIGDLPIYKVGNSSKCIIWNYDIFGFDAGRTRQMADFFAAHGYSTFIPDYYRGTFIDPSKAPREDTVKFLKEKSNWTVLLKNDWLNVKDYAKRQGCSTFGTIGTCWGTYVVIRMSEDVDVKAGISMHPSHPNIAQFLNENEETFYKEVKSPQMFMPAGSDRDSVKSGGLGKQVLGDALEVVEFPDMQHGWTIRGDLSNPIVDRDVKKAFNLALAFFGKYLI